jgi:hypothetical protein
MSKSSIVDPDTARGQLDIMKARYEQLLNEWDRYERDLEKAVRDADKVRLPLWEIAERAGRHRNFVGQWTSVRRRSLNAPHKASR